MRTYETQGGTSFFYPDIRPLSRRSHVQASITPGKSERQRLVLIFWCCRLEPSQQCSLCLEPGELEQVSVLEERTEGGGGGWGGVLSYTPPVCFDS